MSFVSRFLFDKSKFSSANARVKTKAFYPQPNKETDRPEVSVCDSDGLGNQAIWDYGEFLAGQRNRPLKARADLLKIAVGQEDLELEGSPLENFERHTNIVGWPEQRDACLAIAQALSAKAKLKLVGN